MKMAESNLTEENRLPPLKRGEIDVGNYRILLYPVIASGTCGRLCSAFHKVTGQKIAAKGIDFSTEQMKKAALYEGNQAKMISHPNIVRCFDVLVDENTVWILNEFCELGNLTQFMERNPTLPFRDRYRFMLQLTLALAHLHNNRPRIIHRDIKPENVVMTNIDGLVVAKLTDFGHAKMYEYSSDGSTVPFYMRLNTSMKGTPRYMAPEFFLMNETELQYTATTDIFSLGLLFAMIMEYSANHIPQMPTSVQTKLKNETAVFGAEMADGFKKNKPLPTIVQIEPKDSESMIAIKQCVLRMTNLASDDRVPLCRVETTLREITEKGAASSVLLEPQPRVVYSKSEDFVMPPMTETIADKRYWKHGPHILVIGLSINSNTCESAFSFRDGRDNVCVFANHEDYRMKSKWPFVLLEREGSFVELGEEAAEKYKECLKTNSRANVRLVQGWSHISDSKKVKEMDKHTCPVEGLSDEIRLRMFSFIFQRFKESVIRAIPSYDGYFTIWVVTVPESQLKQNLNILREAAEKIGLMRPNFSRLIITTRQKTSAFQCFTMKNHGSSNQTDYEGTRFLVIQTGFTTEITGCQIRRGQPEAILSTCGALGSNQLMCSIESMLKTYFGVENIERYAKENLIEWQNFLRRFVLALFVNVNKEANVMLPGNFEEISANKSRIGESFADAAKQMRIYMGVFILKPSIKRSLFEPIVESVVAHVNCILNEPDFRSCETVFITDMFSCFHGGDDSDNRSVFCTLLRESLGARFKVVCPKSSRHASVSGAVRLGWTYSK